MLVNFIFVLGSTYFATGLSLSSHGPISDREFVATFACPESYKNRSGLDGSYVGFEKWVIAQHPGWTVEQLSTFRYALLELHECTQTLENIRQNLREPDLNGMYVAESLLPVSTYTEDCIRPKTRKFNQSQAAVLTDTQKLRDSARVSEASLSKLISLALTGNPFAQFYLATLYDPSVNDDVSTVTKSWSIANKWYYKAAKGGVPEAEYSLGNAYANGDGVTASAQEAVRWYSLAAMHGYVAAAWNVAVAYETGEGVKADGSQSEKWYCASALTGDQQSQWHMADIYFNKEVSSPKLDYTFYWLKVLEDEGDEGAKSLLDDLSS